MLIGEPSTLSSLKFENRADLIISITYIQQKFGFQLKYIVNRGKFVEDRN